MHSVFAGAAAKVLKRHVKTILTREQMYTATGHRPAVLQRIELGASRDGVLRAVKHEAFSSTAVTKEFIEPAAHSTSRYLYKSPNIFVSQSLVPLDIAPGTAMRAPGEAKSMYRARRWIWEQVCIRSLRLWERSRWAFLMNEFAPCLATRPYRRRREPEVHIPRQVSVQQ